MRLIAISTLLPLLLHSSSTLAAQPTQRTFDYVIAGGGVSGLLLANRLSADPSITVAVLEPGGDERNNPLVTDPTKFVQTIGTGVDWAYFSIPQKQMNNRRLLFSGGKGLGGSSLINGELYSVTLQCFALCCWMRD